MNKYLLIISLVLISLLAIGSVSATDNYNGTDDSFISVVDNDIDENVAVDEVDVLEATSPVENLEGIDEEPILQSELNNQSNEVLSEGDSNDKPTVIVDGVTYKSGEVGIPFHVYDSEGPISGQAIVTILSEKNTLSKDVKLINGSGQINFKITELLGTMIPNNEEDITEISSFIISSITDTINISNIISGFEDIYNGFSINMSNVIDGLNQIRDGINVNVSEINKGMDSIESSVNFNVSSFREGLGDILNGMKINVSKVIQLLMINVTESNFNFSKFSDGLKVFIDEYTLKISNFLDNITQNISFNKTALNDALDDILKEFNLTRDDALNKIVDIVSSLNITDELKDRINDILEGNNLTLSNIIQVAMDLKDSNLTISNVIDALTNQSYVNVSKVVNDFRNILANATFDYDKIMGIFNNTFNSTILIDEFLNATGINITKISNIFDGLMDIFNGISFNLSNFKLGIEEIFKTPSFNSSSVKTILEGILYDNITLSSRFEDFLNNFMVEAFMKFAQFVQYLNLNFTDEFEDLIIDIVSGRFSNFTNLIVVLGGMMDYNNLTLFDIFDGLNNVSGGDLFNISKAIDKILDYFNDSDIVSTFKNITSSISFDHDKLFKGLFNLVNFNMTTFTNGLTDILNTVNFNVSAIEDGFNKIIQEINFNVSDIFNLLSDKIKEYVIFDNSTINEALNKIADAFKFNGSAIEEGASSIAGAFKFDFNGIISGIKNIIHSVSYNISSFISGINKIIKIPCINISDILTKIISKLGKGAVLSFFIIPDKYIYSFKYKVPTQIIASKVTTTYGNSKKIVITLKDVSNKVVSGKKVTVKLNGKTYNGVTNAKGQVSIKVPNNLAPKTYTVSITFAGDNNYGKSVKSVKVVVGKSTPKITAKKKTFKSSVKTKKYTITLKTNKNKVMKKKGVTLKINGKIYKANTNSKGKATFKITKLVKGTYKAVVKFKGDKYFSKATKKASIKVM